MLGIFTTTICWGRTKSLVADFTEFYFSFSFKKQIFSLTRTLFPDVSNVMCWVEGRNTIQFMVINSGQDTWIFQGDYHAETESLSLAQFMMTSNSDVKRHFPMQHRSYRNVEFGENNPRVVLWSLQFLIEKDILMSLCSSHIQWLLDKIHHKT